MARERKIVVLYGADDGAYLDVDKFVSDMKLRSDFKIDDNTKEYERINAVTVLDYFMNEGVKSEDDEYVKNMLLEGLSENDYQLYENAMRSYTNGEDAAMAKAEAKRARLASKYGLSLDDSMVDGLDGALIGMKEISENPDFE